MVLITKHLPFVSKKYPITVLSDLKVPLNISSMEPIDPATGKTVIKPFMAWVPEWQKSGYIDPKTRKLGLFRFIRMTAFFRKESKSRSC